MNNPNQYSFDELTIGLCESFSLKLTESLVNDFAKTSGDYNPLHTDSTFAETTKFGKRVCHGMLLASFFSRLIGMYLPGKNSLFFSQTLNFLEPCYIGDDITIEGKLLDKSEATKFLTIQTRILNNSKISLDGIAKVIFMN